MKMMSKRAMYLAAGLAATSLGACDDAGMPTPTDVRVVFTAPEVNATLTCADDLERSTDDLLEVHIDALIQNQGAPIDGLRVELVIDDDEAGKLSQPVPVEGVLRFEAVPLALGDRVLVLRLIDNGTVVSTARRVVNASIDPADPDCGGVEPPALAFVTPTADAVLDESGDADLSDDLQITVELSAEGDAPVTLTVNGEAAGEASPVDGTVTFEGVTLPIGDGANVESVLRAVQGEATAEITVAVSIDGCAVALSPDLIDGCWSPDADIDPDTDGVQVEFTAATNCGSVVFEHNGAAGEPIAVVDGVATTILTWTPGNNLVQAIASTAGGLTGNATGDYQLGEGGPAITLDLEADDTRFRADLDDGGARQWTISGAAVGVGDGDTVTVSGLGEDIDATVGADGRFSFPVSVDYACPVTLQVSGSDVCGAEGASPEYTVCFDAISPVLEIVDPPAGGVLVDGNDGTPGVQTAFSVRVDDARPADVDYDIGVECGTDGDYNEFSVARRARSDAEDGVVVIPVDIRLEDGDYDCRATAEAVNNAPTTPAINVTIDSTVLGFTITTPDPDAAPVCFGDDPGPSVMGNGAGLEAANAMLVAVVDGAESFEAPLALVLDDTYGADLEAGEGNFTVTVRGMSDRGPVAIAPAAPIPFIVDRTAPAVGLVSPAAGAELGLADDANGDLSDCVQTRLTVSLADANTDEVCWSLNGGVEVCGAVGANGQLVSDEVSLRDGENTIAVRAVDCAGNESNERFAVTTAGCGEDPRSLAITTPNDGGTVRQVEDVDPALDSCQIDVRAGGAGFADGTEFIICSTLGEADPRCPGGGAAVSVDACESAGGAAQNLTCRVTLPDGVHQLTAVSVEANAFSSEAIALTVDCTPPSVESLVLVEDDGDGCVNGAEAGEVNDDGAYAMTLRVAVEGIDDGQAVTVRRLPEDEIVNAGIVNAGVASVDSVLPEGEHALYATGSDAAGNDLPGPDDALQLAVRVDVRAPEPQLLGLVPDSCLNAAADANGDLADMQYGFSANAGGDPGEALSATLTVDGDDVGNLDGVDALIDFMPVDLGEGDHIVAITVTDACGNVGSVAGFDGDAPDTFAVRVDTIAPAPTLGGLVDGQMLAAADDTDPGADGLQVQVDVTFDAGTGPEAGQDINVRAGAGLLATLPADGADGPFASTITLPGGDSALTASATDTCGNVGESAVVNVSVAIESCASSITGFAANPAPLGPSDGAVDGDTLQITVTGDVAPGCGGGTADLLVDGAIVASTNVGNGDLSFPGVVLAEGARGLSLRVTLGDASADSAVQTVLVDLTAPSVVIDTPAGPEPVVIFDDADPEADGQQVVIGATVSEGVDGTARAATVTLNDAVIAGPIDVDAGSPVALDFGAVTLPAGEGELEVCVTDMAGNRGCSALMVVVDPGPPGVVEPVATIIDPRATRVRLDFIAPADNGDEGGRVVRYRIRRSDRPIVTEDDWRAAEFILASGATVEPGELERIALVRLLALNKLHHIAVRGVDENDLEGPFISVSADLRLSTRSFDIDAPFVGDSFFNGGSLVIGVGDVDDDGRGDFLMYGNQQSGEAAAAVVFGGVGAAATQVDLTFDADTAFAATDAGALGDVNGDGVDDIALLGYSPAFDASRVVIYFGGPRADVASPDAVITLPGRLTNFVTGVGNFTGSLGDAFNDVFIGGSPGGGGTTAFVVHGRANWPAELDAVNAADGVTQLTIPEENAGVFAAGIGDIDGDGNADLALGGGGNFNVTYVFYGARELPLVPIDNLRRVALVNPCIAPSTSFGSWFAGGRDLTGDGSPDFLVGARGHKRVIVFDQDLESVDCVGRTEVQFGVNFDIAGDLNNDGNLDLIVTHRDNQGRPPDAMAFYNDGTGHFGVNLPRVPDVRFTEAQRPRLGAAGLGDFNGDGRDDVVTIYKVQGGPLRAIVHF